MKALIAAVLLSLALPCVALGVDGARAVETIQQGKPYFTCPMHPEVHSAGPGECPICHMILQKVSPADSPSPRPSAASSGKRIKFFRNPMNPAITSKKPMKDEMGMDYIPVYEEEEGPSDAKVLGRVPVWLNETELELSGAGIIGVKRRHLVVTIPVGGRAISSSRVSLQIPEHELPLVKPGLEVELRSPSTGEQKLSGKIVSLDTILDPMTRSLRADVQLRSAVPGLRPESSVTAKFRLEAHGALVVPDSALLYVGEQAYVYRVDRARGVLTPTLVRLGLQSQDQAEVVEGLAEGDSISSGPNFLIDSESRIRAPHD